MVAFLTWLLLLVRTWLKSRARLEAENIVLRQQVIVLSRRSGKRVRLRNIDRLIFVWLYRFLPSVLDLIVILKPETVIRWHGAAFELTGAGNLAAGVAARRSTTTFKLYPADEQGQFIVGSAAHSRRTADARDRIGAVDRCEVHARSRRLTVAGLEDVSCATTQRGLLRSICLSCGRISFNLLYGLVILGHERRRLIRFASPLIRPPNGSPDR